MSGIVDEFYNATFYTIISSPPNSRTCVLYLTKYIYDLRNN